MEQLVWLIIGACATVAVELLAVILMAAICLSDSPLGKPTHYVD